MNWVLKKRHAYLAFGVLYFLFWFLFKFGGWPELPRSLYSTLIDIVLSMTCLVITVEVLLPKYVYQQKYAAFMASFLVLVLALGSIIIFSQMKLLNQSIATYQQKLAKHQTHYFYWFWADLIFGSYFMVFFISLTGAGIRLAFERLKESNRAQQLEAEKKAAELELLKEQINPHFLFNALNTIYYKIDRNNTEGRETLQRFSNLLRHQLYECNSPLVEIEQELQFIRSYLELQQQRLNENNSVQVIGFDETTGFKIAPFLLLPLVENCFKHVSTDPESDKKIRIKCQRTGNVFKFETCNTINAVDQQRDKGIGLENLKRRVELMYPGKHALHICPSKNTFTVVLNLTID